MAAASAAIAQAPIAFAGQGDPLSLGSSSALRAPIHVRSVGLKVQNLSKVTAFYRYVVGLEVKERGADYVDLGTPDAMLLRLTAVPNARIAPPSAAGLYHTAFLLPSRADLGAWLTHAMSLRVPITGASDHLVSEAVYLDDPEGNGVEIYRDRDPSEWRWDGDAVVMGTRPLNVSDVLDAAGGRRYDRAPAASSIGHVHLKVGAIEPARAFYAGLIGLDVTRARDGALFLASGGYHHHLAVNTWHSDGTGPRRGDMTGLDWIDLHFAPSVGHRNHENALVDPWGTEVRMSPSDRL